MGRLKFHPRDSLPNRTALARADALYAELRGPEREVLGDHAAHGDTDDVPLSGFGEFFDNWELSQARALSVVRYMINFLDIPPDRLAANGFGQYQPVNTADTPEARAQNRRIELKLTEQ